jgi:hypothetical protein
MQPMNRLGSRILFDDIRLVLQFSGRNTFVTGGSSTSGSTHLPARTNRQNRVQVVLAYSVKRFEDSGQHVVVQNRSCSRAFHPLTERRREVAIYEWVAEGKERKSAARATLDLRKRVTNSTSLFTSFISFLFHTQLRGWIGFDHIRESCEKCRRKRAQPSSG